MKLFSHVQLFATPWTVAYQAPSSMEFSRQEYWSGLPFPSPGNLPDPGIEPGSPALQVGCFTIQMFYHLKQLFVTPWTIALWAPLSMGFSRQEYWCELPCPPPRDLPDPGITQVSLVSPAFFNARITWEASDGVVIAKSLPYSILFKQSLRQHCGQKLLLNSIFH